MTARTRLNGWKEIAAHFGKGVRTVQRWEQVYGLPVRRVSGEGGEIVYAFVDELDAWAVVRASPGHGAGANSHLVVERAVDSSPLPDETPPPRRRPGVQLAGVIALIGAGTVVAWLLGSAGGTDKATIERRPAGPARVMVEGDRLRAYDATGAVLWDYVLGNTRHLNLPLIRLADLDRDGANEVIVRVTGERLDARPFVVLGHDGRVLVVRFPSDTVHFGGTAYTPPWLSHFSFVTEGPDKANTLWLTFTHGLMFPELVEAYDAKGRPIATYWSNGYVNLIAEGRLGHADSVFIGATNNEFRGASLAMFDRGQVRGAAPARVGKYRCSDCPAGRPREYLVFPRSCIDEATDEQPNVGAVVPFADGRLTVSVDAGDKASGPIYYEFAPDLGLLRVEVSREFRAAHLAFESAGRLDHAYDREDFRSLQPVRRWVNEGFVTLATAPVEKR